MHCLETEKSFLNFAQLDGKWPDFYFSFIILKHLKHVEKLFIWLLVGCCRQTKARKTGKETTQSFTVSLDFSFALDEKFGSMCTKRRKLRQGLKTKQLIYYPFQEGSGKDAR